MTVTTSKKEMSPRTKRALAAMLVGIVGAIPAVLLAQLALINVEADLWQATAGALAITAFSVVIATAAGGIRRQGATNIGLCMALGTMALLVVGFPVFVSLEPVWWRFAAGMAGALIVAAGIAYGAPAPANDDGNVVTIARRWIMEPLQLVWRVVLSLVGKDATVRAPAASGR